MTDSESRLAAHREGERRVDASPSMVRVDVDAWKIEQLIAARLRQIETACRGSYRRAGRGGVLVQPTVGQFEAKPRASSWHATTDSP